MAVFSIEIADEDVPRVLGAVASNYNRPEQINNPSYDPEGIPNPDFDEEAGESPENPMNIPDPDNPEYIDNPETIAQFTNRIVRQFLQDHVVSHEADLAKKAAIEALNSSVDISDPAV